MRSFSFRSLWAAVESSYFAGWFWINCFAIFSTLTFRVAFCWFFSRSARLLLCNFWFYVKCHWIFLINKYNRDSQSRLRETCNFVLFAIKIQWTDLCEKQVIWISSAFSLISPHKLTIFRSGWANRALTNFKRLVELSDYYNSVMRWFAASHSPLVCRCANKKNSSINKTGWFRWHPNWQSIASQVN